MEFTKNIVCKIEFLNTFLTERQQLLEVSEEINRTALTKCQTKNSDVSDQKLGWSNNPDYVVLISLNLLVGLL